jgi:hypothetical protein
MTASSQSHLALLLRMRTRPDAQQDNPTVMQDRLDVLPLGVTSFFGSIFSHEKFARVLQSSHSQKRI